MTVDDGVLGAERRSLTIGLVSTVTLVAIEALAVITILPDIEADLVGLSWYGWVTTAFFLGTLIGIVAAGDRADRVGLGPPFIAGLVFFTAGLVIAGAAPSMPVLVLGRFVQGLGAGVVPAIAYVAIGRTYPESLRPRMFAVLSTAWVVPGIIGPTLSERVSAWIGWRWVFLGLVPLVLIAGGVTAPAMRRIGPSSHDPDATQQGGTATSSRHRFLDAILLASGAALVVGALTANVLAVAPMLAGGLVLAVPSLRRLTPRGTLRAVPALPAVIATRGLLTFAFFGADTFVPHTLTDARLQSTASGSIAVTASTLGWTAASWVQERRITTIGGRVLIRWGFLLVSLGIGGVATTAAIDALPVWLIHVSWALGGTGIGLAYSVHSQLMLSLAPPTQLGSTTSALQLSDNLGVALGAGLTGAAVTFTEGRDLAIGDGIALSLLVPITVGIVALAISMRRDYPGRPPVRAPVRSARLVPGGAEIVEPRGELEGRVG